MILLRPICWLMTGWYSLRYWMRGGVLSFSVSGHRFVEGANAFRWADSAPGEDGDYSGPVEWHTLTCELCGAESRGWSA